MMTVEALGAIAASTATITCWTALTERHAAKKGQTWGATPRRLKLQWLLLSLSVAPLAAVFVCLLADAFGWWTQ